MSLLYKIQNPNIPKEICFHHHHQRNEQQSQKSSSTLPTNGQAQSPTSNGSSMAQSPSANGVHQQPHQQSNQSSQQPQQAETPSDGDGEDGESSMKKSKRYEYMQCLNVLSAYLTESVISCKVSSKNIIAFCQYMNYECKVFVCDLIKPWQKYEVCSSSKFMVRSIDWNYSGDQLLLGYKSGRVDIWTMRYNCLNAWSLIYYACLEHEEIVEAKFFRTGNSYYFSNHKKELSSYSEKFEKTDDCPTISLFGGTPGEGCFLLTTSGILGSFLLPRVPHNIDIISNAMMPSLSAFATASGSLNSTLSSNLSILTKSGSISSSSIQLQITTRLLDGLHFFVNKCSLTYCPSGSFNLATTDQNNNVIYFYKVAIGHHYHKPLGQEKNVRPTYDNVALDMKTKSLRKLFLNKEHINYKMTMIRWITLNACDEVVFVIYESPNGTGSFLEQWNLMKKHQTVHKFFQMQGKNAGKSDYAVYNNWELMAKLNFTSILCDICISKLRSEMTYIILTFLDNSVQMYEMGLKKIILTLVDKKNANSSTTTTSTGINMNSSVPTGGIQQSTLGLNINSSVATGHIGSSGTITTSTSAMTNIQINNLNEEKCSLYPCHRYIKTDITYLNQLVVMCDSFGQIYTVQLPNNSNNTIMNRNHYDKNFKMNNMNTYALPVALIEYALMTGFDIHDVLIANINQLELIADKLTENFTRQPAYLRHYLYANFLSLKSNICRVIQPKHDDFDNLLILHAISITLKSLLRPADLSSQDKGPAENLSLILSEQMVGDIDKILCILDAKDFTVEPITLQSLQQIIQWVSDLALIILNKLPEDVYKKRKFNKKQLQQQQPLQQQYPQSHYYDISRDIVAIGTIRELLVMIRIWGLLNPLCLPNYTKSSENFDVLPVLFRLLTRLIQNPNEPDDSLLEDCNSLCAQVLIPTRQLRIQSTILNYYHANNKLPPYVFQMNEEPFSLLDVCYENILFAPNKRDDVANTYIGANIKSMRLCVRCGFVNNVNKIPKTAALRTWFQRWKQCYCGGFWIFTD